MRFVQVSDTHIVPRGRRLHRLDPVDRLERCISAINNHHRNLDLCLFTGDLTDKGDVESYQTLREILGQLDAPYKLLIGNHDRRETFLEVFPESPRDEHGFIQQQVETPGGRFLCLDTVDEGKHSGLYCEQRQAWLAGQLDAAGDEPVYLFMHHPPFDVGFPCLDRMKLEDADGFAELVTGRVEHIFFGHVHRPLSGNWRGIPFSALPGTNHQVATDTANVTPMPYSHGPPAYAFVHLDPECRIVHLHNFIDDYPRRLPDKTWTD